MSKVQYPQVAGRTQTANLLREDGTVIEAGVACPEISPGVYEPDFATVADGVYRITAFEGSVAVFTDPVLILAANSTNPVNSEKIVPGYGEPQQVEHPTGTINPFQVDRGA